MSNRDVLRTDERVLSAAFGACASDGLCAKRIWHPIAIHLDLLSVSRRHGQSVDRGEKHGVTTTSRM